jgi:nitric oxide reductase activation protein
MRAQLAGLLQAARLKPAFAKQAGHRIDVRSVHLIACRSPDSRVFASRREKVDENTAIVLLIDRSGSMDSNDKIKVARQAAFVIAEALELLRGVTCAVGAFPWGDSVVELKSFGEKPRASRFSIASSGGTPMAEALMWAGMLLTHRPETRRIVIAMTDGQPDDAEKTKKAVERLTDCRIEVYGIGILDSNIDNWLSETSKVIRRIEELPAALIGLLKEALVTRRKAA